jgi:rhodanese-related sulfurtransferase
MPQQLTIATMVLGAVMLLLALVSGGFKIFGAEIPGVAGRSGRIIAFVIGIVLVGFSLAHFQDQPAPQKDAVQDKPAPAPPTKSPMVEAAATPAPAPASPAPTRVPEDVKPPSKPAVDETLNDPSAVRVFGREGVDFGVAPRDDIEPNVGTLTPLTIPGAQTISTGELYKALSEHRRLLLIDVLDRPHAGIPTARRYSGVGMASPSTDLRTLLGRDTGGDKAYPLVFYCQGAQCWESYNAALRARDAGYTQVYWYRGGLEAWSLARLPMS